MSGFVAVHTGAGEYSMKDAPQYEVVCRVACKTGVDLLRNGKSAVEVAATVTALLENEPITNAGIGSNLTTEEEVECDACIMDGESLNFGAVGAVSGVRNPIYLAWKLCRDQTDISPLGLIPPSFLVGSGARKFAQQSSNIVTVDPHSMITSRAIKLHASCVKKMKKCAAGAFHSLNTRMDTIGAVCMDSEGRTAATCSSGGILLKTPGRVGQAGMYGCGCWAEDTRDEGDVSVAISTSGCGEYLMKTTLAKEMADSLKRVDFYSSGNLHDVVLEKFTNSRFLKTIPDSEKLFGTIALLSGDNTNDFFWAHSTANFFVGYMGTGDKKPKTHLSSLPSKAMVGTKMAVECVKMNSKRLESNKKKKKAQEITNKI